MSDNKTTTVTGWRRPPGPINVWKTVDGEIKLDDGTRRSVKFSIQEVSEDRREETIDFMLKYFIVDEPICKSMNAKDKPEWIHDFRVLWTYCLEQGIVEAAYLIDSTVEKPELVAINMLFIMSDETEKEMRQLIEKCVSSEFIKVMEVMTAISKKSDACKIFQVDKYISAFGLAVASHLRGQKLGLHMLEARTEIGRKYGIPATSTVFTARVSQVLAERAGFKDEWTQNYADILDEDGKRFFPNIESKNMKIMMKKF